MEIPQITDRMKGGPMQVLRAFFAGIGRILMSAERPQSEARTAPPEGEAGMTERQRAEARAAESRWRSLDHTGNVRLLSAEDLDDAYFDFPGRAGPDEGEAGDQDAGSQAAAGFGPGPAQPDLTAIEVQEAELPDAALTQAALAEATPGEPALAEAALAEATLAEAALVDAEAADAEAALVDAEEAEAEAAAFPAATEADADTDEFDALTDAAIAISADESGVSVTEAQADATDAALPVSSDAQSAVSVTEAQAGPAHVAPDLPLPNYDSLSLPSIRARLRGLTANQLRTLINYERTHAERPEVLGMFERRIDKLETGG